MARHITHSRKQENRTSLKVFAMFVASVGVFLSSGTSAFATDCAIASSAIESAASLRGLSIIRPVPCKLENKQEVEQYLRETIAKKIPRERIDKEGTVYRMLGLLPYDYEYLNGIIKLYTEQLGGYYDPEKEYYAMAAWMPAAMQMPIAVHELTHALQDQHFELDKLIDHEQQDSDSLMARSALIEGDATAVMLDFSRSLAGQGSIAEDNNISMFMVQNITGAMLSGSLHNAPPALQATLIFPYVSGLNFAHALLKDGGYKRIDKAFKQLPTSTEEILHPDKYLSGKKDYIEVPVPEAPADSRLSEKNLVLSDRYGEFFISTLIGTWLPPHVASNAASGWGGDRIALYQRPDSAGYLLAWNIHWDTEKDAVEFFDALVAAYAKRYNKEPVRTSKEASFIDPHFGVVRLTRDGQDIRLVIGS